MKKVTFLLVIFFLISFLSYAQNPDYDYGNNKNDIKGYSEFSPLTSATWTTLAVSPHAVSRSCCAAIKSGDTVFVFQFGGGASAQLTNVARYNSKTNTWTNNYSTMPAPISAGSAVALPGDSVIYVIGGNSGTSAYGICLKYNVIANTWTTMAVMPTSPCTDQLTVVYRDSLIFCVGGGDGLFNSSVVYNAVRIYNSKTNTWTMTTSLPTNLSMSGGGIWGDTIYVFCGVTGSGVYTANCYKGVINPTNLSQITWTTLPVYPSGSITRMASFVVVKNNSAGIMCSGGAISGGTLTNASNFWNFCTQSWQTLPNNSLARSNFKGTGLKDSIAYITAGYTTTGVGTFEKITFSLIDGNCLITSINNQSTVPDKYELLQNYPNPFNPITKIQYSIPKAEFVKLSVFDILGKEIDVLVNGNRLPGSYIIDFDASSFSSGVYFYKVTAGDYSDIKKMMLIK